MNKIDEKALFDGHVLKCANALIRDVAIETSHGQQTMWITLHYGDGSGQGYGGYALGDAGTKSMEMDRCIKSLSGVFGKSVKKLAGTYCRVAYEDSGADRTIYAIGHILEDRWFTFSIEKLSSRMDSKLDFG